MLILKLLIQQSLVNTLQKIRLDNLQIQALDQVLRHIGQLQNVYKKLIVQSQILLIH